MVQVAPHNAAVVQHLIGPTPFPPVLPLVVEPSVVLVDPSSSSSSTLEGEECANSSNSHYLSLLSYNVLLPNSVDGWWNYKMYLPPLDSSKISTWEYRKNLIRDKLQAIGNVDVVCFQEVSPVSFDDDFSFMRDDLGYDQCEMFKKGRFRPATFWKGSELELASPPVHKDRTLLTAFRRRRRRNTQKTDSPPQQQEVQQQQQQEQSENKGGTTTKNNKSKNEKKNTKNGNRNANDNDNDEPIWYVLNCHLQAGSERRRRVRQMNEGVRACMTLARKLNDPNAVAVANKNTNANDTNNNNDEQRNKDIPLLVCGDFNGGEESAAVRYLEDGYIDDNFREDGQPVTSGRKDLPLHQPMIDVMAINCRSTDSNNNNRGEPSTQQQQQQSPPPPTLVVNELVSYLVRDGDEMYEKPTLSNAAIQCLTRIYEKKLATTTTMANDDCSNSGSCNSKKIMGPADVEKWLIKINGQVGRGSEYREAIKQMTGVGSSYDNSSSNNNNKDATAPPQIPTGCALSLQGFLNVYESELQAGKFWGIAYDMAVLSDNDNDDGDDEPLLLPFCSGATATSTNGPETRQQHQQQQQQQQLFEARYDRIYCSSSIQPVAIIDFTCDKPCPNDKEPSDHLPIAASFIIKQHDK